MRVLASILRNMNDPAEGAMFFPSVAGHCPAGLFGVMSRKLDGNGQSSNSQA